MSDKFQKSNNLIIIHLFMTVTYIYAMGSISKKISHRYIVSLGQSTWNLSIR